jgi:hypothetical protein
MEVSGQLQAPAALSPWKEPLVPIGCEAGISWDNILKQVKTSFFHVLLHFIIHNQPLVHRCITYAEKKAMINSMLNLSLCFTKYDAMKTCPLFN